MSHDPRDERRVPDLREPVRPLPDGLRRSLLAIPEAARRGAGERSDGHDLYLHALARAETKADAGANAGADGKDAVPAGLRPAARAVVELLTDFLRHERRVLPLPQALRTRLHALPRRPSLPRWIAEPRWAAAACWVLAFLLTFGTGDVSARLVEAAGDSLSRAPAATSRILEPGALWPRPARDAEGSSMSDVVHQLKDDASAALHRVRRPLDRLTSRAAAWQARAEALGARTLDEIRRSLPSHEPARETHPETHETGEPPTHRPPTPRTGSDDADEATGGPSASRGEKR